MKFRKVLLGAAAILGAVTLAACSSGSKTEKTSSDKWETYQTNKSITIGFDNTFVPMGFENESGQNVGFDIELAEAVFAEYDIKVKWQPINWDMKETELNNETIDLIWNGYSVTKERQEKVLFTDSYMVNEQVLVTKKSSNITAVDGMSGKVLGAQAGSAGYSMFEANSEILKDIVSGNDATQYSTFTEALIDLDNGRIDGLLIDRVYANYYLTEEGILDDYNIIDAGYETDAFAAGARKSDTTLVEKINEAFKVLYEKGKFQEISEKWFGEDVATENVK
ncbi:polar amino acid transport system substrate-binding protein [Streptococcus henryi]|uniref:Polar amino acid transport system substrate-binding protein n=1 Tax=Streptococcus henryi TaxID=439219 RepID=A0A1G6BBX9_9STRE|nr:transporter substrate-binding domain-containing protein [Streptococcus henryi]SDB18096.1 polar amino acid transport system substrate-binding protein [Streptococcus henryi]